MLETRDLFTENQILKEELQQARNKVTSLQFQIDELRRLIFGSKSERFISSVHPSQLSLLEIPRQDQQPAAPTITINKHERTVNGSKENHPVRSPFPEELPREDIYIYPDGYDASTTEKPIGEEVTEVLDEIPGKFIVKRYHKLKFASREGGITIGRMPSRPIEKGLFGELLLARILIDKYVDHLPLYRQQQRFTRAGITLAASTLGDVPRQCGQLMEALYNELIRQVLESTYLQADETPHPVQDSRVKGKTHRGFFWVYRSVEQRLVLFDYREGRGRDGPQELLKNYKGFIQTDGYGVYDLFENKPGITLTGCMAHARRYFEKALGNDNARAEYFINRIQDLYSLERKIRNEQLKDEQILALRKEQAVPVLQELECWLEENILQVTPSTPIGKAIAYALSRWKKLIAYVDHARLEIDNNLVENAIRPTVVGRKNYMFSGSHDGARRSAMMYSFFGSCKMNHVNPQQWLPDVLQSLPDTKSSQLFKLLPNNWKQS
jgi:transposase